jgi:hypothetical protein
MIPHAYKVQVGKGKGAYTDKYSFASARQAVLWYNGINVHSGHKKRLIDPFGKTIARELT